MGQLFSTEAHQNYSSFFIKYLRTLGFHATNDVFAENAWYFRNALVRANYNDLKNGVHATTEYLELFLRNLMRDEKNELHNRTMHISGAFQLDKKADIEGQKADIRGKIEVCLPDLMEVKSSLVEVTKGHGKGKYCFNDPKK